MSNDRMKEFARAIAENEDFRREAEAETTLEGRLKVFAKHGFADITKEDIESFQKKYEGQTPEGELSEEELEAVAGGGVTAWLSVAVAVLALL